MRYLIILTLLCLNGCASILNGDHQQLTIRTQAGSEIFVDNTFAGIGVAKVSVARDELHTIEVKKDGCHASMQTQAGFNKTSLLGLFIAAGLITIPIDFSTGAAWQVEPSDIKLVPEC